MSRSLVSPRSASFKAQGGRCYYCGAPIWEHDLDQFAARHGLSRGQARRLQCTGEHLVARSDGGGTSRANIVAACLFCNHNRHRRRRPPPASTYRTLVARRMKRGQWHPREIHRLIRTLSDPPVTRAAPAPPGPSPHVAVDYA